jgi:hypothetical protein
MKRVLLAAALLLPAWMPAGAADSPIALDRQRGIEQTFLTYPEWFLVHSPAEYATLVDQAPPHRFPFLRHVQQLWSSYMEVTAEQARRDLAPNPGYHVMIMVIATSTTVEYALRSLYENTFGRLSWAFAGTLTDEDLYAAKIAQDYVDFIRAQPWYLFDYSAALSGLWRTPAVGDGMVRKWERRYALTTEYLVKGGYAWLIEKGTRAAYDPAALTTQVVADRVPAVLPKQVTVITTLPDGRAVLEVPRYFAFRIAATELARGGTRLVDIAGNTGDILVTVWAPAAEQHFTARVLFEQPLLTTPGRKRVALVIPVGELSRFLLEALRRGWSVEHVHDY